MDGVVLLIVDIDWLLPSKHTAILYYTVLYCTILYYTVLYCTILYYTILYYTVLYCTILYYTILYYTILCKAVCIMYLTSIRLVIKKKWHQI